jgi:hypothetical protein
MALNRVELGKKDVLVYKGFEIDRNILDAIVSTDKRLLWAFERSDMDTTIRARPYSEEQVIWMSENDVVKEHDVEI